MKYIKLDIAQMALALNKFDALERGIYFSLLLHYCDSEKPLPDDFEYLMRLAGARGRGAPGALASVLKTCFSLEPNGWHCIQGEQLVTQMRVVEVSRLGAVKRQNTYREKQRKFIVELAKHGVFADLGWKLPQLQKALCDVTGNVTKTTPDHSLPSTTFNAHSSNEERAAGVGEPAPAAARAPRPSVQAVKAMRLAGMSQGHPDDPRLIAALDDGVPVEALAAVAAEAAVSGKGFAWAVSTARGRYLDSKKAQEGLSPGRGGPNASPLRGWVRDSFLEPSRPVKSVDSYKVIGGSDGDA